MRRRKLSLTSWKCGGVWNSYWRLPGIVVLEYKFSLFVREQFCLDTFKGFNVDRRYWFLRSRRFPNFVCSWWSIMCHFSWSLNAITFLPQYVWSLNAFTFLPQWGEIDLLCIGVRYLAGVLCVVSEERKRLPFTLVVFWLQELSAAFYFDLYN